MASYLKDTDQLEFKKRFTKVLVLGESAMLGNAIFRVLSDVSDYQSIGSVSKQILVCVMSDIDYINRMYGQKP